MKSNKSKISCKRGFTLIELLVVVLIIGILAAVAVPQYQKAVDKSRLAAFIPLIKAVANAKSEYYLATGEWPSKFESLSVELPKDFTISDNSSYKQQAVNSAKGQVIFLDATDHRVMGWITLTDDSVLFYYMPTSELRSITRCAGTANKRAEQLCKSLPGAKFSSGPDGNSINWYNIL